MGERVFLFPIARERFGSLALSRVCVCMYGYGRAEGLRFAGRFRGIGICLDAGGSKFCGFLFF